MTTKDNGGATFPFSPNDHSTARMTTSGMSLRDWFAGQALITLGDVNPHLPSDAGSLQEWPEPQELAERRAKWAYLQADAMLAVAGAAMTPAALTARGVPMWCDGCRAVGAIHCAHPDQCGNMKSATAAVDNWKAWLDDLPLPFTFDPAIGRLQDFLDALACRLDAPQPAALTTGEKDD